MEYGYVRISTSKQNMERQVRNIRSEYPHATICQEIFTGTKVDGRRKWEQLLKVVKEGDTIIFDSVSRMSRNADEGIQNYEDLFNRGVELVFLKEPHINTEVYKKALHQQVQLTGTNVDIILEAVNRYLMALVKEQIYLAFQQSEKEVSDLRQRTKEGIESARLRGKQIGQAPGKTWTTKKAQKAMTEMRKHAKAFGGTLSDRDCMRLVGISSNTYYKYKQIIKKEICIVKGSDT